MKMSVLITVLTGILSFVFLAISLGVESHSVLDRWSSFGLGFTSVLFIGGLVSLFRRNNWFKSAQSL